MKRITLGALDYGLAFGVDRTLRNLLVKGQLSAVGCMVATDLWSREFVPIRQIAEMADQRALIGVTVALSGDRVRPMSPDMQKIYGTCMPRREKWQPLAFARLLPDEVLEGEVRAQIAGFVSRMGREPDFLALREGLMEYPAMARIVLSAMKASGLAKNPYVVTGVKSRRIKSLMEKAGLTVLPWAPPLPETGDVEELQVLLKHHFDGLPDMAFVAGVPGKVDDRLRRDETKRKIAVRECHRQVLGSQRFFNTLNQREVFLN